MTTPRRNALLGCLLALAACAGPGGDPFERRMPILGTELFVKSVGEGEPLIVVHGGPVLEHGYLAAHFGRLAENRRVIYYDQRLCGRSAAEAAPESIRIATFVADIEALRVALGLDRFDLLGHSWGGLLAMRYAIAHGQNLRSLILLSPVAASAALWQKEQAASAARITEDHKKTAAAIRASQAFAERRPEALQRMLVHSFRASFHDPKLADRLQLFVPEDYMDRSRRFGAIAQDLAKFDHHPGLAGVQVPTLVLFGASEPGVEIGGAQIHASLPNSELVTIPDAGHFPFVEQPEAFFAAVEGFLARR